MLTFIKRLVNFVSNIFSTFQFVRTAVSKIHSKQLLKNKPQGGWPLSSHDQIAWLFLTFQVNIYGESTLATVAIQNEMHVFSLTAILIYTLITMTTVLQQAPTEYFKFITHISYVKYTSGNWPHTKHNFLTTLKFPDICRFSRWVVILKP